MASSGTAEFMTAGPRWRTTAARSLAVDCAVAADRRGELGPTAPATAFFDRADAEALDCGPAVLVVESPLGAAFATAVPPAATTAQTPSANASPPTRPTHADARISQTPAATLRKATLTLRRQRGGSIPQTEAHQRAALA